MAKQTVNIGVTANDNTGDPLRTAFDKLNDNFDEVYAAGPVGTNIQVSDNTIASTNTNGNIDLDPAGTGKVLINGPMDANGVVTLNSTVTGNITPTANVTYNIGGTSTRYNEIHGNIVHVGPLVLKEVGTALEIFQADGVTNAILSGNSTTAGSVLNNGNTVVALTQDGPITFYANNYQDGGATVTVINTGNITTPAVIATGNVTGGNLITSALVSAATVTATGNVTGGNLNTAGQVVATGNITGGNVSGTAVTGTLATAAQPNVTSVGTLTTLAVTGNVTSGNLQGTNVVGTLETAAQPNVTSVGTLTSLDVTGNVGSGNVNTTAVAFGSTGIQERATYEMFHYLTSDESAISATPTDAFGVSPNLDAGKFYEFFIQLRFTNSSTGNPVFGFTDASGDLHEFNCQLTTGSASGAVGSDTKVFNNASDTLTTTTLNTAQDYVATYFGSCRAQTGGRLDINLSVSAGTVTPLAGSSFRFTERTAASFGDVA